MSKTEKCDNKSAGAVVRDHGNILMIERLNYPKAYALPAGHLDGDDYMNAMRREIAEEANIVVTGERLAWRESIGNPCKREGGDHHVWEVYEATEWNGEPSAGDDAGRAFWASNEELNKFAARTEYFSNKYNIPLTEVGPLTRAIFGDPKEQKADTEWLDSPGLEPVWYYILAEMGILPPR